MESNVFVVIEQRLDRRFARILDVLVYDKKGHDMTDHYPRLKAGRNLVKVQPRVFLRRRDKKKGADFLHNLYLLPIVNQRMRDALEQCRISNIEYYGVDIVDKTSKQITHDYKFLNVIGMYPLIDWEKSKWTFSPPRQPLGIKLLRRVVLRHDVSPEVDLLWLEEPRRLIAAGELAQRFLHGEFSGVRVTSLLHYRDSLA